MLVLVTEIGQKLKWPAVHAGAGVAASEKHHVGLYFQIVAGTAYRDTGGSSLASYLGIEGRYVSATKKR